MIGAFAFVGEITEGGGALLLMEDADPNIPILKEAKAEYAKLK